MVPGTEPDMLPATLLSVSVAVFENVYVGFIPSAVNDTVLAEILAPMVAVFEIVRS